MLRITPERGTFSVAREVTFDASRRFPRTAGGLGCSATISGLGGVFIAGSDIDQPSCRAEKPRSGSGEAREAPLRSYLLNSSCVQVLVIIKSQAVGLYQSRR